MMKEIWELTKKILIVVGTLTVMCVGWVQLGKLAESIQQPAQSSTCSG